MKKHEYTEQELALMRNFLFRALHKANPRALRDVESEKTTLEQECRWARLDCRPLPEEEE